MSQAERDWRMMKLSIVVMLLFFTALTAIALHGGLLGD